MSNFSPRLDILPEAQRRLWGELSAVPNEFVLYGGTALALHLGHRKSVDFDFFGSRAIDVPSLESEIPFLAGAKIVQREQNTLSAIVDRGAPVKVSFFGVPKLPRLAPPLVAKDNDLKVASLLDLAGTKASVLQVRAEAKDYIVTLTWTHLSGSEESAYRSLWLRRNSYMGALSTQKSPSRHYPTSTMGTSASYRQT